MDGRAVKRSGLMMVAALFGAAVIVGGLATVEEPGEAAAVAAGSTRELQVTGVAGVPSDADAVALNMTIVNARAAGFATVYPCGQPRPEASNLNYAAGQTIPNLVIAKPGVGGKVCIYTYAKVDVLADVSGYFPNGSGFTPIANPTRVLDTRSGVGAPVAPVGAGSTLELQVAGAAGVPSDADAVVLNMTVVNAQAAGFATVYPCGQPRPEASNLNYAAGQTIPNLVIAKPGTGGRVCIYSYATIDALADVSGFYPTGSPFTPIPNPTRVLDTRGEPSVTMTESYNTGFVTADQISIACTFNEIGPGYFSQQIRVQVSGLESLKASGQFLYQELRWEIRPIGGIAVSGPIYPGSFNMANFIGTDGVARFEGSSGREYADGGLGVVATLRLSIRPLPFESPLPPFETVPSSVFEVGFDCRPGDFPPPFDWPQFG